MAGSKLSQVSNSRAVLGLIGLTICYQIAYQTIMRHALNDSENAASQCDSGPSASSPKCLEAQLFRSWKQADLEERAALIGSETEEDLERLTGGNLQKATTPTTSLAAAKLFEYIDENISASRVRSLEERMRWQDEFDKIYNETLAILQNRSRVTPWATELEAIQEDFEANKQQLPSTQWALAKDRVEQFDKLYNDTLASLQSTSSINPFAKELAALQEQFEAHKERLLSMQRDHAQDRLAQFDKLYNDTLASIRSTSSNDSWASELAALQAHFEAQHKQLLSTQRAHKQQRWEQFDKLYNDTLASLGNSSPITPWAKNLMALQENLQSRMEREDRIRATLPTTHSKAIENESGEEDSLLKKINQFGRELCEAPQRRGRRECAQFLTGHGHVGAESSKKAFDLRLAHLATGHQEWQDSFVNVVEEYGQELCTDPRRVRYPACAKYLAKSTDNNGSGIVPVVSYSQRLTWSSVAEVPAPWSRTQKQGKKGPITVNRSLLRSLKWQGKIPKVSCVTVVPPSADIQYRLKYFLNNFALQNYEGPRQLVLVFNYMDHEVSKLVRSHADGTYIKAVAARGGGEFPSTQAFRFGAYSADADIIARWNFDEWHHPDRLSMQVRALVLNSRPVSLLKRWTVLGESRKEASSSTLSEEVLSSSPGWQGSMVGEASWMREHWMPLLTEERSILASAQSEYLVHVDIPELIVYDAGNWDRWENVLRHFDIFAPPVIEHADVCFSVANMSLAFAPSAPDMSVQIGEQLGPDLSASYLELAAKREDVARRLSSLCKEADAELEQDRRRQLLHGAGRLAEIWRQLDERFVTLEGLFSGDAGKGDGTGVAVA